jgi:hypothetical protein
MAHYVVTLNQDNLTKGTEVQIHGLGVLKNGETIEVSAEDHERFRLMNQVWEAETDKDGNPLRDDEGHELGAYVPGPTLKQANVYGLEVEFVPTKEEETKDDETPTPMPTTDEAPAPAAKSTPPQKKTGGEK